MGRRAGRGRRRRSRRARCIVETFTFSVLQGETSSVQVGTLTSRPPRSNFRPLWMEVEVCGYQPGSASQPGWLAPVGCQIGFRQESNGNYVSTSRLLLATSTPKKLRTRYPRSADWWPYNITPSMTIADIHAVCVGPTGPAGTIGYLRGIGRLGLIVQEEMCVTGCPSLGSHPPLDRAPSVVQSVASWVDEVDKEIPLPTSFKTPSESICLDFSFLDLGPEPCSSHRVSADNDRTLNSMV